jgi:hypothetical protein
MIEKPIQDIDAADLQRLVDNAVPEGRRIEYKEALPGNSDGEKKEFLADVSSFANAIGGDIVFGITEARDGGKQTGIPATATGLSAADDPDLLRLENLIRDGISPRVQGIQLRAVPGLAAGPAVVIRIPQSWSGPHVVSFQQWSRFYSRNNGGKYPLDVFELRQAFTANASAAEQVRLFIHDRIGKIGAADGAFPLDAQKAWIVHVVPLSAVLRQDEVDLHLAADQGGLITPLYATGYAHRFNLDGFGTYELSAPPKSYAYFQLFRRGAIEGATTAAFNDLLKPDESSVAPGVVTRSLVQFVERALQLLTRLDVGPPAIVQCSFTGVKGMTLAARVDPLFTIRHGAGQPFSRDPMILPDVRVDDFAVPAARIVKPILDALWQAAGYPRSLDYDDQGELKRR